MFRENSGVGRGLRMLTVAVTSGCILLSAEACAEPVDFSRDIQPLLAKRCFSCHGPDTHEGGLRLDQAAGATAELGFRNAAKRGLAVFIETARLGLGDRLARTDAIRKERLVLLSLEFVLFLHVRENPKRRLRELLAAESEDSDHKNRDDRVGEEEVAHQEKVFSLKFSVFSG
jgi:hypothetical protein